jgi:hypothetical protein
VKERGRIDLEDNRQSHHGGSNESFAVLDLEKATRIGLRCKLTSNKSPNWVPIYQIWGHQTGGCVRKGQARDRQ